MRGGVRSHDLRVLKCALAPKIIRDPGGPQAMIADAGLDACLARISGNHPMGILLRHAVRGAGEAACGAKQRPILVVCDARSGDVRMEIGFELGYARRFVLLAAFFMQANPCAPSLSKVVAHIHLQHSADTRKGVDHHGNQRPVTQSLDGAYVYGGEQGSRLLAIQHRSATFNHNMLRPSYRMCRIYRNDLPNDEPIKEHPYRGQVLLDCWFGEAVMQAFHIGRDMHRFHVL